MKNQQENELPNLPQPFGSIDIYEDDATVRSVDGFTADQMRGYALDYWNRRAPAPAREPACLMCNGKELVGPIDDVQDCPDCAGPAAQEVPAVILQAMEKGHPIYDLLMLGIGELALVDIGRAADYATKVRDALSAPPSPSVDQAKRLVGGEAADSARLDWLESSTRSFTGNFTGTGWRAIGSGIWVESLREAIDGARIEEADRATTGSATPTDGGEGDA